MDQDIDLIKSVFEHRLKQNDLDRILHILSATDRNQLVRKIGDLLRQISALVDVSNKMSDTLELDVLLPRLMIIVSETLNSDRSTLFLHDPETDELFSKVAQGNTIGEIRIPRDAGIAGAVFTSGDNIIINDAYADPRFNQEVDRKTGYHTRNILCAPIKHKGVKLGVIQVLNKNEGDFNDDDLNLLGALTAQAASALDNARLYEKVEKARAEEARLLEVTNAIASELKIDILLHKIINAATYILNADRSSLFVYDKEPDQLWSRVAEGLSTKEIRFPSNAGIAGACFTSGNEINIPDAYKDERFNPAFDKKTGYRTRSILCMPVITKNGDKIAVIQVLNKKGGIFTPQDEKRLRAFCAQAAIALENAKLFEDVLNERNYNESVLMSLSNGVITLDSEFRISKLNNAALNIVGYAEAQMLGRTLHEMFENDNNQWIFKCLTNVIDNEVVELAMDSEIDLGDGRKVSVNLSIAPLLDIKENNIGYILILEDITKEKRVRSTMSRYLTKEVADQLLEHNEDTLGGVTRQASVLFSDIRSFTTLSEELGARDTVSLLNDYFTDMVDVIFSHGGILDKYIGDAIMAVYGTPFPKPTDAQEALDTANEMMMVLYDFNRRQQQLGRRTIRIGIGISTGDLVAGNIGSPKRMDYTVIGDTVNLAARLESATKYYGVPILFCDNTRHHLTHSDRFREIDQIIVKGQNTPVSIFQSLNHLPEEVWKTRERCLEIHNRALRHYKNQDWNTALKLFHEIIEMDVNEVVSKVYAKRCLYYRENPPGDDWHGVWTMQNK